MLPAIYQSNFHPTASLLEKNKRKTYVTLIRQMHSLGRGEGRAGLLSDSKYMHWLQDEIGLGSRFEQKRCRWAMRLSEPRPSWDRSRGWGWGWWGATEALLTLSCQWCFEFVLWRPATGKNKQTNKHWQKDRRKERNMGRQRETETERERDHHHYGQKDASRDMMQSTLNDILRNPSPSPQKKNHKGKNIFLNPDFINTWWCCNYRIQSVWG